MKSKMEQEVRVQLDVSLTVNAEHSAETVRKMVHVAARNSFGNWNRSINGLRFAEEAAIYSAGPDIAWTDIYTWETPKPGPEVEKKEYSLCEAVADLAANFEAAENKPGDSRETVRLCIEWARAFEAKNVGVNWGQDTHPGTNEERDYLLEIDEWFAVQYGRWLSGARDVRKG